MIMTVGMQCPYPVPIRTYASYATAAARPPPPPKNNNSSGLLESHGHATDTYNDERPIWIYVDDSNIWITAKKLAAKKMKTKEDHRVRIDVGKLTNVVAKGRAVEKCFLYGSEPPAVDTIWEKIEERGWQVPMRKKKSKITRKEKGMDAQLVADITQIVCTTPEEERTTIVIISGDADAMPAINLALDSEFRGWNVEVCMWKDAMSNELKKLPKTEANVEVHYLDEFLEYITYTNMKFDSVKLDKANAMVFQMEPEAFCNRVPTKKWCRELESITQWPFQYYWAELNGNETNDLVLVFRNDDKTSFDLTSFLAKLMSIQFSILLVHCHMYNMNNRNQGFIKWHWKQSGVYYTVKPAMVIAMRPYHLCLMTMTSHGTLRKGHHLLVRADAILSFVNTNITARMD